jgi:hypothetical protein
MPQTAEKIKAVFGTAWLSRCLGLFPKQNVAKPKNKRTMDLIDTHCHPHFDNFLPEPDANFGSRRRRRREAGSGGWYDSGRQSRAIKFAASQDNVWARPASIRTKPPNL